jgi:ubiquinone biosynthesis protein UbiJ
MNFSGNLIEKSLNFSFNFNILFSSNNFDIFLLYSSFVYCLLNIQYSLLIKFLDQKQFLQLSQFFKKYEL